MPIFQDQVLGQKYLTIQEQITGEDHELLLHLSFDVVCSALVKQIATEFQAGEGWSKIPTGSDVAPTGHTTAFGVVPAAHRRYILHDGSNPLDMGLTLHENNIQENATIELRLRT